MFPSVKTVNIHEAKTTLSKLLNEVEMNRETIVICRNGKPVANLVPYQRVNRTKPHPVRSRIKIQYHPIEPLTGEEWPKTAR